MRISYQPAKGKCRYGRASDFANSLALQAIAIRVKDLLPALYLYRPTRQKCSLSNRPAAVHGFFQRVAGKPMRRLLKKLLVEKHGKRRVSYAPSSVIWGRFPKCDRQVSYLQVRQRHSINSMKSVSSGKRRSGRSSINEEGSG